MKLFNKRGIETERKISQLPDLPEAPQISPLPKSKIPDVPAGLPKIETHELPILPTSEVGERFNQEAIKEAIGRPKNIPNINPPKFQEEEPGPEFQREMFQPRDSEFEQEQFKPEAIRSIPTQRIEDKRTFELPEIAPQRIQKPTRGIEPIFIRLDKFEATSHTFEEIKIKIEEIEELLKKTREIKAKEEDELAEWEREIQIIKSRLDLIDKNIFNRLNELL